MMKAITRTPKTQAVEIQIGDSTHHQDQSILSSNFNVIKTMVSKPAKPIPELEELLFSFIFSSFLFSCGTVYTVPVNLKVSLCLTVRKFCGECQVSPYARKPRIYSLPVSASASVPLASVQTLGIRYGRLSGNWSISHGGGCTSPLGGRGQETSHALLDFFTSMSVFLLAISS